MVVGLDTTVLLRLIVGEPIEQFRRAEIYLRSVIERGDRAVVSDLVVAEAYFALQHHYGIAKAEALSFLVDTFESGQVESVGFAGRILTTPSLASAKPGFVDRMIHATYEGSAAEIATFEKKAAKLNKVKVL